MAWLQSIGLGIVYVAVGYYVILSALRPWYRAWGATPFEWWAELAGDEVVPEPKLVATRAITIQAAPCQVWPLIQETVKSLELQLPKRLARWVLRDRREHFTVLVSEPDKRLVLGNNRISWSFTLVPVGLGATRLMIRTRVTWPSWWMGLEQRLVQEPAWFFIERKMLLSLKRVVEDLVRGAAKSA